MVLRVKRYLTKVNASNCYLCWCEETLEGAIVDPAEFSEPMRREIRESGIGLQEIYLTHAHYDHNSAVDEVKAAFDIPMLSARSGGADIKVYDGDKLKLGQQDIRVVSLPGHTEDSIAFIAPGLAFVGDALFAGAVGGTVGRLQFERETAGLREKILSLPPSTILYPGHGPATTVAIERCYNPFFFRAL